ncbi:hypothetical protein PF008_g13892 [Phytophthora fragariae]|uniref:Uncharacterized protein n=1 Tax=Phytophthora fragariae TaxID=53985 RepID=A0A6G0RJ29_9STRA|nr:hypothetical protein PF008_g13892 [Phytophthora fragariae]
MILMTSNPVPPLVVAVVVLRSRSEFQGLPHVTAAVSLFLDTSGAFSPLEACKLGSARLLDRIWHSSHDLVNDSDTSNSMERDPKWLRRFLHTDKHYQQYIFSEGLMDAVPRKNLELVQWLLSTFKGLTVSSEVVARACLAGSMETLQLLYANDSRVLGAGCGNHVEWGESTLSAAIQSRRSDVVWWLFRHIPDANYNLRAALWSAVQMGDVLMAEWLVLRGAEWPDLRGERVVAHEVAALGRVDVLQWLEERGQLDGVAGMVIKAAEKGRLDTVRWLIERTPSDDGSRLDATVLRYEVYLSIHGAAINGHLEVAKCLREFSKRSISSLRVNQLPMSISRVEDSLPQVGNAQTVCSTTMTKAALNGHLDVVKWLFEEYGSEPNVDLFVNDNLMQRSFTNTAMDAAASAILDATAFNCFEVFLFLHTQLHQACTEEVLGWSLEDDHRQINAWIVEHHPEFQAMMDGEDVDQNPM